MFLMLFLIVVNQVFDCINLLAIASQLRKKSTMHSGLIVTLLCLGYTFKVDHPEWWCPHVAKVVKLVKFVHEWALGVINLKSRALHWPNKYLSQNTRHV